MGEDRLGRREDVEEFEGEEGEERNGEDLVGFRSDRALLAETKLRRMLEVTG